MSGYGSNASSARLTALLTLASAVGAPTLDDVMALSTTAPRLPVDHSRREWKKWRAERKEAVKQARRAAKQVQMTTGAAA